MKINSSINEYKKDSVHYLMRDILSCFPNEIEGRLIFVLNQRSLTKEATRQILKEEINNKKPNFRILSGALTLQFNFLRQMPRFAFYEVLEIMPELHYCFNVTQWKTIKKLSAHTILTLFSTLYYEFIILPLGYKKGKKYINLFKKYINKDDLIKIINIDFTSAYFIMRNINIDIGHEKKVNKVLLQIIDKFYLNINSSN